MYYIGIDLGTSAVKLLLMDETGSIANIVSREYPIAFPHPGWSEQDPADWWAAVCDGIPALLDGFDASQVKGIGAGETTLLITASYRINATEMVTVSRIVPVTVLAKAADGTA